MRSKDFFNPSKQTAVQRIFPKLHLIKLSDIIIYFLKITEYSEAGSMLMIFTKQETMKNYELLNKSAKGTF